MSWFLKVSDRGPKGGAPKRQAWCFDESELSYEDFDSQEPFFTGLIIFPLGGTGEPQGPGKP